MKKATLLFTLLIFTAFAFSQGLSESFETWPPSGWTLVQGPCSPTNDISQNGLYYYDGSYSARFSSYTSCSNGYDQFMVTPELVTTAGDQTFSFWYRKYSSGTEYFMVGWSSTGNNVETDFTWSDEITASSTSWQQFEKTDLPVGTKFVAIHYTSNYEYYFFIDDVSGPAVFVPSCLTPGSLSADAITITTADLSWMENGEATTWDIELGPTGFSPTGVPTEAGVSNPYTYEGLDPATAYDWYVRADCGGGDYSDWTGPHTFVTLCDAITVPYTENFDGDWVGDPAAPLCWTVINNDDDSYTWTQNDTYLTPHSDPWVAHGMGNTDDYLITPAIDLTGINAQVLWWDIVESSTKVNSYKVLVSTTDTEIASFTDELTDIDCSNMDWEQHTLNLSDYNGQTIYIAFYQYASASTYYGFGIDDFSLELAPDCIPPVDLTATNITTTSADLGWTEEGEATVWNVELGESGFTPTGTPTHPGVENPVSVDGLTPATAYDFYVQADCGAKAESPWAGPYTFVTLCEVSTVPFSENFDGEWLGDPGAPTCWTVINADDDSYTWTQDDAYITPHSEPWVAHGMGNSDDYLVTPAIDLTGIDAQISWWDVVESASYENSYKILVSTTDTDIASFTDELADITCTNTDWEQHTISLSDYNGQTIYVAFYQYYSASTYYGFGVDDVLIDLIPPPGYVSGVVTDGATTDPIEGVLVESNPEGIQATTNAFGEYELELMAGEYELSFTHPDYNPTTETGVAVASEETTNLDVTMMPLQPPYCATLVAPLDNSNNNIPVDLMLEWAPDPESPPVDGYKLLLYNVTDDIWIENETDLGNVTSYAPAGGFEWGKQYAWIVKPYNNAGEPETCPPWYFNTSFSGMLQGVVTDAETDLPLEGVNVHIEQVFPNPGNTFDLTTDENGEYSFEWESAIYNVSFSKYAYQTETFNNKSINTNQVTQLDAELVPEDAYALPFFEGWSSGSFATQKWSIDGGNWYLTTSGNPGPSAIFYWDPEVFNYEQHLQSFYIDARNESQVFFQFDLELSDYFYTGTEDLTIKIFDGETWYNLDSFTNYGDFDYTTNTYDISAIASGKIIRIDFEASGVDNWNINWWHVDNILVTNDLFEISQEKVVEVMFFDETKDVDINLMNLGAGTLDWEAVIDPPSAWLTIDPVSGTLSPGSQTLTLSMDATQATKGEYSTQVILTINGGLIQKTIDVEIRTYEENGQEIMIPGKNEWGYISSYVNLDSKMTLEDAMADISEDMIIMIGTQGIFWPGFNINTIGDYNTYEGYKMKMGDEGALAFLGNMVEDKTVTFPAGTYIIPILNWIPVDVQEFLGDKDVEFAFGMDGTIYWPDGPIYTLETFLPGYGYLVKFNSETTLDFNVEPPKDVKPNNPPQFENTTTWNDVYKTGDFHMLAISAEATADLEKGDIIGVFNSEGLCTGMINYTGNGEPVGIPVFADDMTTEAVDGMTEYEPMQVKIFRDGNEFITNPTYSMDKSNHDGLFAVNGFSLITSFKEGATSVGDETVQAVSVYPNPSDGLFNIEGINEAFELQVTNSQGQVIAVDELTDNYTLDISDQPTGIYFIRLVSERGVKLVKVVKQ